ncbi:Fur family transcriptional regulator [Desulfitibacter alkalitolerans]|uniref:Fur family transcriptional regulator n=1 Tax=Desulfitibacter alkalitolerans TaxID=264641 RepID=UPI00054DBC32|nr:transcriptional repressor [Desulfitibacter alkalitolerans]
MTRQKKIILEVVRSTNTHPTADWIYEQAKKELPDISLGTVYRNLKLLRDMGEILELNWGSTFSRYDGITENHYHFVCKRCGKIMDLQLSFNISHEDVEKAANINVETHRLEFYGTCNFCD